MNSMTGFGKCEVSSGTRKVRVEVKTVNHRYLDINIRMPLFLGELEAEIRSAIKTHLSRGRVEIAVQYASQGEESGTMVNYSIISGYLAAVEEIASRFAIPNDTSVSQLMLLPDVISTQPGDKDLEIIRGLLKEAAEGALDELVAARKREGEQLKKDMTARLAILEEAADRIEEREPLVVDGYRTRLRARIAELQPTLPLHEERLEQEVAVFADRCNVTEEVVRIRSHIGQFRSLSKKEGPVGKNLDFILQELNREFNTVGSKAQDTEVTNAVIAAKAEIEKIREQVQNIE